MPKYVIHQKSTGKTYEINAGSPKTQEELQSIISSQPSVEKSNLMPDIGQITGGIIGGIGGGFLGHPHIGSAVGGTMGRGIGTVTRERAEADPNFVQRNILPAVIKGPAGIATMAADFANLTTLPPESQESVMKETKKAGISEAAFAPLSYGASKGLQGLGKMFIGKEAFKRGKEVGFKNVVKKEYLQERLPQNLVKETSTMFDDALKGAGKEVGDAVATAPEKIYGLQITDPLKKLLPPGVKSINDLEVASKSQKDTLNHLIGKILKVRNKDLTMKELWELRRDTDKIMYGTAWKPDMLNYIKGIRATLNAPLKSNPKIVEAFSKFELLENLKETMAKPFEGVTERATGEVFNRKLDATLKAMFKNPETQAMIKKVNPEIAEKLISLATARNLMTESAKKPLGLFGSAWNLLTPSPLTSAKIANIGQRPLTQAALQGLKRAIPTTATGLFE